MVILFIIMKILVIIKLKKKKKKKIVMIRLVSPLPAALCVNLIAMNLILVMKLLIMIFIILNSLHRKIEIICIMKIFFYQLKEAQMKLQKMIVLKINNN